jgi:hydrogenase nickel incorporation protein HypA/HybF
MHELPVTQGILDIALRYGEEHKATRVTDLYLLIGDLSSIVDDSVQFYWDIVARGTIAEGATLHFDRVPMRMVCFSCGVTFQPRKGELQCTECESTLVQVAGGDEFRLESIGIEQAEETKKEDG